MFKAIGFTDADLSRPLIGGLNAALEAARAQNGAARTALQTASATLAAPAAPTELAAAPGHAPRSTPVE